MLIWRRGIKKAFHTALFALVNVYFLSRHFISSLVKLGKCYRRAWSGFLTSTQSESTVTTFCASKTV